MSCTHLQKLHIWFAVDFCEFVDHSSLSPVLFLPLQFYIYIFILQFFYAWLMSLGARLSSISLLDWQCLCLDKQNCICLKIPLAIAFMLSFVYIFDIFVTFWDILFWSLPSFLKQVIVMLQSVFWGSVFCERALRILSQYRRKQLLFSKTIY